MKEFPSFPTPPLEPEESAPERIKEPKDPRDYFRITSFQKKAEAIDEDKSHPWAAAYTYFIAENKFGTITAGTSVEGRDKPFGLLLAEKQQDGSHSSIYRQDLPEEQRTALVEAIMTFSPHLKDDIRHQFVRKVIAYAAEIKPEEIASEKTMRSMLDLLPDIAQSAQTITAETIHSHPIMTGLDPEKQEQLTQYLSAIAGKMPVEEFETKLQELYQSLQFRNDPLGKFYHHLFFEIAQWVLDSRDDTKRDYALVSQPDLPKYYVNEMVQHPIASIEDLKSRLAAMTAEMAPDVRGRKTSPRRAEMIALDQVVGGQTMDSWLVSTSEGRGLERIFELTRDFQNGSRDVVGKNDPISVVKINGKYYIEGDGRHRTAALKVLGVKEVPMLVTEVE